MAEGRIPGAGGRVLGGGLPAECSFEAQEHRSQLAVAEDSQPAVAEDSQPAVAEDSQPAVGDSQPG